MEAPGDRGSLTADQCGSTDTLTIRELLEMNKPNGVPVPRQLELYVFLPALNVLNEISVDERET